MTFNCIAEVVVYLATALFLYIFAGYPVILFILAKLFPKKHLYSDQFLPSVTPVSYTHLTLPTKRIV